MNRTTIGTNHVYGALDELEFGKFKDKLQKALDDYKALQTSKKEAKVKKKNEETTSQKAENTEEKVEVKDDELEIDS